eukprot:2689537-Prorocentrum_lima.AAC.1
MSSASTWAWPQTQKRYKGCVLQKTRGSFHRLLEPGREGKELDPSHGCSWEKFKLISVAFADMEI